MGELRDEDLIYSIRSELHRIGESVNGDRVKQWCIHAGYKGIHDLDRKALEALYIKVSQL